MMSRNLLLKDLHKVLI